MEKLDAFYDLFVEQHKNQLSLIPETLWRDLCSEVLNKNEEGSKFEKNTVISLTNGNNVSVLAECRLPKKSVPLISKPIYMFDYNERHKVYEENNPKEFKLLTEAMNMSLEEFDKTANDKIARQKMFDKLLFRYARNFCLDADCCGKVCKTYWYVLDKYGSSIEHSFRPNMKTVPFVNQFTGEFFNIFWPIRDIKKGDPLTVNLHDPLNPNEDNKNLIAAVQLPWKYSSLMHLPCERMSPNRDAFVFKYRPQDLLPEKQVPMIKRKISDILKVYSEYKYIQHYLNDEHFTFTDKKEEADILWLLKPFYDYKNLAKNQPNTFINQFPYESILTVKDLFCQISRFHILAADDSRSFTTQTFDLQNELEYFVACFQQREKAGKDNRWIVKPWNLARSKETIISDDVNAIIRMRNSIPKVVQKYIHTPATFYRKDLQARVKYDLRFIVMMKAVRPLEIYAYKKFWIRFANKEFSLTDLHDYEKHFTVMNYLDGDNSESSDTSNSDSNSDEDNEDKRFKQMFCDDFIQQYNNDPERNGDWDDIEMKIHQAISSCFQAATISPAPIGVAENLQSRALYGVDVMIRKQVPSREHYATTSEIDVPTILEINYAPDCKRACEYYPTFYNDIFNFLFRDQSSPNIVKIL